MSRRVMGKTVGAPTQTEYDPLVDAAIERTKAATEARWARMAGPVTTRRIGEPYQRPPRK